MRRMSALLMALTLALASSQGQARAQWGYGYYPYGYGGFGWGGWGGTAQGDVARGLGYFNMGAGIYNRETAVARSINYDTAMRWNQYVYNSQLEANRNYLARREAAVAKDRNAYDSLIKRLQENPTASDVANGNALNAALDQLSDPRIHSSALRSAGASISAATVREIPFRNASEAITFSLAQIKRSSQWPAVLMDPRFADERADFEAAVDEIRKHHDETGEIPAGSLKTLRDVETRLRTELEAMPLGDRAENQEALNFVKTAAGLTRLLEKPEIDQVLDELRKIDKTTIGNLLAFMQTFNLRFAPATTPRQRQIYGELFTTLDTIRDQILKDVRLDQTQPSGKGKSHDFFSAMDLDHIEGKKKTPPAPAPQP